jgi:hypothetical protein
MPSIRCLPAVLTYQPRWPALITDTREPMASTSSARRPYSSASMVSMSTCPPACSLRLRYSSGCRVKKVSSMLGTKMSA